MTHAEIRHLLATVDARALRLRCGISASTIARALGVHRSVVYRWETRQLVPSGPAAPRYARIIAALDDHDAITIQLDRQQNPPAHKGAGINRKEHHLMKTLAQVTEATGFAVLKHLEAEAQVPILGGLQAQGDLFIVPIPDVREFAGRYTAKPIGPEGIAVIEAVGSGHEHRLFAGAPGTATFGFLGTGQDIGILECTEPAYVLHPEHGATGIAPTAPPAAALFRRQREQADEERLVAD